jgi:histidine phosphotransfer protein HptB
MPEQGITYKQKIRTHLHSAYLLSEERIDALLPRYLASLRDLMHTLDHIAETASPEETSRAGHALKGALLTLGLTDLAEKVNIIEQKCKSGGHESECAGLISELKEEIAGIV